jgi:hypothetical protein
LEKPEKLPVPTKSFQDVMGSKRNFFQILHDEEKVEKFKFMNGSTAKPDN